MSSRIIEIHPLPEYTNLVVGCPGLTPLSLQGIVRIHGRGKIATEFVKVSLKIRATNFIHKSSMEPITHEKDPYVYPLSQEVILFLTSNSSSTIEQPSSTDTLVVQPSDYVDFPLHLELPCFDPPPSSITDSKNACEASAAQEQSLQISAHQPIYQNDRLHHGPFRFLSLLAECKIKWLWPFPMSESIVRNVEILPINLAILPTFVHYFHELRLTCKKKDLGYSWNSSNQKAEWNVHLSRKAFLPGMPFQFSWQVKPTLPTVRVKSISMKIMELVDVEGNIDFEDFFLSQNTEEGYLQSNHQIDLFHFEREEEFHGQFWKRHQVDLKIPVNPKSCFGEYPSSTGTWGRDYRRPSLKVVHLCEVHLNFKNADPVILDCFVWFMMLPSNQVAKILADQSLWNRIGCEPVLSRVSLPDDTDRSVISERPPPEYITETGASRAPSSVLVSNEISHVNEEDDEEIVDAEIVLEENIDQEHATNELISENSLPDYNDPVDFVLRNEKSQFMSKVFGRSDQERCPVDPLIPSFHHRSPIKKSEEKGSEI